MTHQRDFLAHLRSHNLLCQIVSYCFSKVPISWGLPPESAQLFLLLGVLGCAWSQVTGHFLLGWGVSCHLQGVALGGCGG